MYKNYLSKLKRIKNTRAKALLPSITLLDRVLPKGIKKTTRSFCELLLQTEFFDNRCVTLLVALFRGIGRCFRRSATI